MRNLISPYYAVTEQGNLVWVSEFNDKAAHAGIKALHAYRGQTRYYNAGDVQVLFKSQIGLFTAVSAEVATNLLTIKLGASQL